MTPLRQIQQQAGAQFTPFGEGDHAVDLVESFGRYPAEYAAIRQRVGILHLPQRGLLRLAGPDVKDFLHRLLTQDINAMTGGGTRRAFQLNHKGRIVADPIVHHGDIDTWLEVDRVDVQPLHDLLQSRHFAEDLTIEDWSDRRVAIALQGPAAPALLQAVADEGEDASAPANMPGTHHVLRLGGVHVTVYRWDDCGVPGLRLMIPTDAADALYAKLLTAAGFDAARESEPDETYAIQRRQTLRGRPVGWAAYNTARIEAGTPLFHIDFGPDSLPAETGLLEQAVSFTKGCYLGQEIVARMKHLGHPRRVLVGLRTNADALPITGAQVFAAAPQEQTLAAGPVVGGVTSSTVSPLLGQVAIAFAVVKWGSHQPDTLLLTAAEGKLVQARVQGLRFLDA